MNVFQRIRYAAAWAACCGMSLPLAAFGDDSQRVTTERTMVRDVALTEIGSLMGHVVDSQGQPVALTDVVASQNGTEVSRVRTNSQGQFELSGVQGGVVELTTPASHDVCRVWQSQFAPPAATAQVMLVQQQVVRGQYMDPYAGAACDPYGGQMAGNCGPGGPTCGPCGPPPCGPNRCGSPFGFLANPWVIGGAIAAAIAIPLALADDDDDDAS